MNFLKYCFSLIMIFPLYLEGINRNQLPNPQLESTTIEWWFPTNLPPKLHMTLRYFEIGDIWKDFSHKNILEKRRIKRAYPKLKADLIQAKNKLLDTRVFTDLFKTELANNETYTLAGIDIIGTHPDFYDDYVLDTSFENPAGIPEKISKLKNIFEHGDPFETEIIKTRKGRLTVPKYKWYLIAKLENNIINFRNKLALNPIFNQFSLNTASYLPHITLGKIDDISDIDKLISAIRNTNIRLSKETIERRSFKLQDIERFHPNDHKIYLRLDKARKSNMIFMLVIGWDTRLGKLLKNIVKRFGEEEVDSRENSVESYQEHWLDEQFLYSNKRILNHLRFHRGRRIFF